MCLSGSAFIILPPSILDLVILVIGASVCFVAAVLIAAWAFAEEEGGISMLARRLAIGKAIVLLVFGAGLMLVRSSVSRTVCIILGVLLAMYSLFRLTRPGRAVVERTAGWYAEGIVLVGLMLLGAMVAILPFRPQLTAGIALLAFGAKLLADAIERSIKRRRGRTEGGRGKRPRDIHGAHFVDKSDN